MDFHVDNFIHGIFGVFDNIHDAVAGALGAVWTRITGWWGDIVEAYDRGGGDALDGIARVVFGEKRKSDGMTIPISGFRPTSSNTEARSVWEYMGLPVIDWKGAENWCCLLYTSPSPRDRQKSRMPSSA